LANLEKHVKGLSTELMLADFSEVPGHRRSPRLIGSYTKNRKPYPAGRRKPIHQKQPFLIRLQGMRATPESRERMEKRVRQINQRLEMLDTPFRLKLM